MSPKFRQVLRTAALNCLVAASFVLLAWTAEETIGLVLAAAALVLSWFPGGQVSLGGYVLQRTAVVCALIIAWLPPQSSPPVIAVVAAAGVLLAVIDEPILRTVMGGKRVRVANLPGYSPQGRVYMRPEVIAGANIVAVAVLLGSAWGHWSPWPMVAAMCIVTGLFAAAITDAVVRRGTVHELSDLTESLAQFGPRFMVHFSAPEGSDFQLNMWLPYFERIGRPFVVVLREAHTFTRIAASTEAPVLVCSSIAELDASVVPSLRAVFYVNNGMKNTHSVRFSQLTHIQLMHGDSDKVPSFNPVTAMFDKVFVAGPAGVDRYSANGIDIPPQKFSIVGRPQVEKVQVFRGHISERENPVVLYAPTWKGYTRDANHCSLPVADKLVRELLDRGVTLIVRAHPYTNNDPASARQLEAVHTLLAEDAAETGRNHLWGDDATVTMSLFDCFNASDAMVADVSSVVSDYLFSEKPFAITEMIGDGTAFVEEFPLARAAYVLAQDGEWSPQLDSMLGDDPLAQLRRELKVYYLGDFGDVNYAEVFLEAAREHL